MKIFKILILFFCIVHIFYVANYRTYNFSYHHLSLVPFLLTPPLPSNRIYHKLFQPAIAKIVYVLSFLRFVIHQVVVYMYKRTCTHNVEGIGGWVYLVFIHVHKAKANVFNSPHRELTTRQSGPVVFQYNGGFIP